VEAFWRAVAPVCNDAGGLGNRPTNGVALVPCWPLLARIDYAAVVLSLADLYAVRPALG